MYNADRLLTHVGIRNQLVRGGGLQRAWLCAQRRSIEFWPQPSQLMESGVRRPQPMASPRCMMAGQKNRVSRPMAPGGTGVDPEPRCWDEPKNPGPWPLARLAARFATCLFRTAPKPAEGSSGAARRDFRSSGQPCGIDVTLISSEQQTSGRDHQPDQRRVQGTVQVCDSHVSVRSTWRRWSTSEHALPSHSNLEASQPAESQSQSLLCCPN